MPVDMPDERQGAPILAACHLTKRYSRVRWFTSRNATVTALEDVSLSVFPRSTVALVGESGSGKTTLARCLAGVLTPDAGEVWFDGSDLLSLRPDAVRMLRHRIQMVFQHSACAMNPRFSAAEVIEEPLRIAGYAGANDRRQRVFELMGQVGLPRHAANRPVLHLSGGQKQRLAIARALSLSPAVLILDEALSGLDRLTQSRVANLLLELQASLGLSLLFISHEIRMAAYLADRFAVIHHGRIIESGSVDLITHPQKAHTRKLLAAAGAPGVLSTPLDK
jgi:peptide/nickel transport system ATP-binding protein